MAVGETFNDSDNAITTEKEYMHIIKWLWAVNSRFMWMRNYYRHTRILVTKVARTVPSTSMKCTNEHLHLLKTSSSIFNKPADRNEARTSSRIPVCAVLVAIVVCLHFEPIQTIGCQWRSRRRAGYAGGRWYFYRQISWIISLLNILGVSIELYYISDTMHFKICLPI